jgi:gas vesicle protein
MRRLNVRHTHSTEYSATGCFLAGIAIGIGIGMLLAPSAGAETRGYIRDRARDWRERANELMEEGRQYVQRRGGDPARSMGESRSPFDEHSS